MIRGVVIYLTLQVAAAQEPNPCTTAAPATPAPPPPPPVTCGNFMCPAKMALKAEAVCAGGMCNVETCCFENPCTTATTTLPTTVTTTPETTVTTTLPTTVTTTPEPTTQAPPDCSDFTCPPKFALKSPAPVCAGGMCSADVCCFENPCTTGTTTIATTVTTTPETTVTTTPETTTLATTVTTTPEPTTQAPPDCSDFTCPAKFALKSPAPVCPSGMCNADVCCFENPCTTGTTTIATTVTTTPETTVTTTPEPTVTTTLATTVTTTPALTCSDFKCPPKFALKSPAPVCAGGMCSADVCCFENPCTTGTTTIATTVTTTPETTVTTTLPTTVTTTPAPTAPPASTAPNPCAPQVRLYDEKEGKVVAQAAQPQPLAQKEASTMSAWTFPVIGMFAMLALSATLAVRARRRRYSSNTRQVLFTAESMHSDEPMTDGEPLLEDGLVME